MQGKVSQVSSSKTLDRSLQKGLIDGKTKRIYLNWSNKFNLKFKICLSTL